MQNSTELSLGFQRYDVVSILRELLSKLKKLRLIKIKIFFFFAQVQIIARTSVCISKEFIVLNMH